MDRPRHYALDEHGEPRPVSNVLEWAEGFEKLDRVVSKTEVLGHEVSTVFLGLDHNYEETGEPLIWETMVFGPTSLCDHCERCGGPRANAIAMHEKMLADLPVMIAKARLTQ
jgi:hypothetical protein